MAQLNLFNWFQILSMCPVQKRRSHFGETIFSSAGSSTRPNIDAVLFFVQKIYPLVSEHLRDAKFYIIGDKAPPEIVALATERIVVAGLQRDVRPFFDSVKLSVAPLRFGAGVKGKINQSMAFGVPVVATSLAVEGMDLTDHEDILVADEPEDFARALIELYESEELWNRLSENGIKKTRALVFHRYRKQDAGIFVQRRPSAKFGAISGS